METQDHASNAIENLLTNKLEIPLVDARIVRRDRLTEQLKLSMKRRVTLLVAPTGYGKTTLLVEWLSTSTGFGQHVVWVTLDQFDNAPLRFWSYIVSGLKQAYPQLRFDPQQIIQPGYNPNDLTLLDPLLNGIAHAPYPITLILDDYHTITNDLIHHQMGYLIDHLPQPLNLVISSRVTPPIPLSRLRAQRGLLEISERELAFSLPEAQSFFTNVMNLDVDVEQVTALLNATEGWIAGLQLGALSYQSQLNTRLPSAEFLPDNRLVLDYLTEEVLNQQSKAVQEFLLKTSILDELSAELCDVVLDRNDSVDLLAQIEDANLFMVCLDDDNCGYRYHSLFAQVLQIRLRQTYPRAVAQLHLRACDWLLANGLPDKAVSHALAAGALEKAAEIIDTCALKAIWENDLARMLQWISHFSKDMFIKRPQLGIYNALANYHLQRLDQVEVILQEIEQLLATKERPLDAADHRLEWELSAMKATIECSQGDQRAGIVQALAVLDACPPDDRYFCGFVMHTLALTYKDVGDWEAAIKMNHAEYQYTLKHHRPILAIHPLFAIARMRKQQGRLREAEQKYQEAYDLAVRFNLDANRTALAQTGLLDIALEQNDMERTEAWVVEVSEGYQQILEDPSAWAWLGLTLIAGGLVRYYLAINDLKRAMRYLKDMEKYMLENRFASPEMLQGLIDTQVRVGLAQARVQIKSDVLSKAEVFLTAKSELTSVEQLALARIHLANQQPQLAQRLLERLAAHAQETGEWEQFIEVLSLLAPIYQAQDQTAQALQALDDALALAEPAGYVRVFIEGGDAMKQLLASYVARGWRFSKYAERLLAAFGTRLKPAFGGLVGGLPEATILGPAAQSLSQRELEVLDMLIAQKSYREIASILMISVNTTKIHVKNIYRKLGVHSRKLALERARELKLFNGVYD